MRILNVNCIIDQKSGGGTAERTLSMSKALLKRGHEVTVLSNDIGSVHPIVNKDVTRLILIPCWSQRFFIPKISSRLYSTIKKEVSQSDIVQIMSHWALINALVFLVCKQQNKEYLFCPAGALNIFGRSKFLKQIYNILIGNRILRGAKRIIAITENEAKEISTKGVSQKRIVVIPNGIHPDAFSAQPNDFRQKYQLPDKRLVLYLGRLNRIKGPDLLLQAVDLLRCEIDDFHFVMAGPDEGMRATLDQIIETNGLNEKISFVGNLDSSDRANAYHACELLVIPSRQEAMSIVVLEAGICGTPVVMTDACGFDQIQTIGGGFIVSANKQSISEGLHRAFTEDNLKKMGDNLKRYVNRHYTWDLLIGRFLKAGLG